jgi:hypothetical protein
MKPINFVKIWGAFCLMSAGLLMQGCVADDLSVCGISMHFKYTRNIDGVDKFSSSINKINLYVFDKEGLFVEEYVEERDSLPQDFTIFLNLTPGVYDFIAWGNLGEDYERPLFEKGVTRMSDVQLSLKRNAQNAVTTLPDALYHGGILQREILATDLQFSQQLTMDMIKDTKEINVTAHGLAMSDPTTKASELEYGCFITSRNGDYRFDNSITGDARVQYVPQETVGEEHQLISNFVIMRELSDGSTASRLVVNRNAPSGEEVEELINVDLVPVLIALADAAGHDFEVKDHYDINLFFDFTHSSFTITIPGWEDGLTGGIIGEIGGKK